MEINELVAGAGKYVAGAAAGIILSASGMSCENGICCENDINEMTAKLRDKVLSIPGLANYGFNAVEIDKDILSELNEYVHSVGYQPFWTGEIADDWFRRCVEKVIAGKGWPEGMDIRKVMDDFKHDIFFKRVKITINIDETSNERSLDAIARAKTVTRPKVWPLTEGSPGEDGKKFERDYNAGVKQADQTYRSISNPIERQRVYEGDLKKHNEKNDLLTLDEKLSFVLLDEIGEKERKLLLAELYKGINSMQLQFGEIPLSDYSLSSYELESCGTVYLIEREISQESASKYKENKYTEANIGRFIIELGKLATIILELGEINDKSEQIEDEIRELRLNKKKTDETNSEVRERKIKRLKIERDERAKLDGANKRELQKLLGEDDVDTDDTFEPKDVDINDPMKFAPEKVKEPQDCNPDHQTCVEPKEPKENEGKGKIREATGSKGGVPEGVGSNGE